MCWALVLKQKPDRTKEGMWVKSECPDEVNWRGVMRGRAAPTCTWDCWSLGSWSWLQTLGLHAPQTRSFGGWERANSYKRGTVKANRFRLAARFPTAAAKPGCGFNSCPVLIKKFIDTFFFFFFFLKREGSRIADNNKNNDSNNKAKLNPTGDGHTDISQPEVETLQEETKCHLNQAWIQGNWLWVSANMSA